jgi:REP element-mobilizing transposase RayT
VFVVNNAAPKPCKKNAKTRRAGSPAKRDSDTISTMVRWYHTIFTAYGFWLPNDPRGSWSDFVGAWDLFYGAGHATKTFERRSLAHDTHDSVRRRDAKSLLKYDPVRFNEQQRDCIAAGIERACNDAEIDVHALAVSHDHVHAIVARHNDDIEQIVRRFKSMATKQMNLDGCHPLQKFVQPGKPAPTPWADGCWKVFINDDRQLQAAIEYVNRHPAKDRLPFQRWSFIKPPVFRTV